ncbi:hypothetical protein LSH36_500g03059 [Paralvinella palmiformis]|uniref:Hexosyltransferase n=1 Tax=Paralvinella palmiformis TaxID=53620 RepID=A0AAD9J9G1_9ANNE|nr:hypothetical protein LSH36_500g03059 [Paralvinella palmiformis]
MAFFLPPLHVTSYQLAPQLYRVVGNISRAVDTEYFQFLLKTDDDCYLNTARIINELSQLQQDGLSERIWWGRFRHNWAVETHGKWSERDYTAPVYPKFACGAGYVISQDVVLWLASNADQLYAYQGEDVSMGIWLSAIHPYYIDDPFWQCDTDCISAMYAAPDFDPPELRQLWSYMEQCDDPCGCS